MISANVSHALAEARAARVSALSYHLHLLIPSDRRQSVRGRLRATFNLSDADTPLVFDFTPPIDHLETMAANGERATPTAGPGEGQIQIPTERLRRGANTITFSVRASADALHRQDEFLYSLFVPARASAVVPCFDQPDLKARWQLTLVIPHGWTALSNGRETACSNVSEGLLVTFEETAPLPTYLFAVVAGRFSVETADRHGRRFRMLHRETDSTKLRENRDALIDLHAEALAWLEDYTAIPYPFGKFDFVLIPSFQFSGMEHPGAIYYNASSLMLDRTATHAQQLARANVIAHEVAHLWFGDLVTMTWFDDVWTKEVFAGFLADKVVNPMFPALDHDLRFLWHHYPSAYDVDRTRGANPIRQPLENIRDAGSLYGPIIYQKAPIIMRQLEDRLSATGLRDGLREYLATYAMGNANWSDLLRILERRSPEPLASWSDAWVEQAGRPTITTELRIENGLIVDCTFRQSDDRGGGVVWPQWVPVLLGYGSDVHRISVNLCGPSASASEAIGRRVPDWILPACSGVAPYARFVLDPRSLAFVTRSLHRLPDPSIRAAALLTLWDAMLEAEVPPRAVWRQLLTALRQETDQLNVQQMLDYLRLLFWRVLSPDARQQSAVELEEVLRNGLARAGDVGAKATWFAALRSLALSPAAIDWLVQLWRRDTHVPGLPLAESDDIDLALDVAVRAGPLAQEVLRVQLDRIENLDRKARLAFVAPALSPDRKVRDSFFDRLRDPSNRRNEAWVVEAARYIHHPLRRDDSDEQLVAALSLVREIHDTGDIFFARRWTDAALAGAQSRSTASTVRRFVEALPADYPHRLRWIILASADLLLRELDGEFQGEPDRR